MNLIYIVGPLRAENSYLVEQNVRKAESVSLELWKLGFAVICPHMNTRNFVNVLGDNDKTFLEGDFEMIKRCDGVFCLEGFRKSEGSLAEVKCANVNNVPVFDEMEIMIEYFRTESKDIFHVNYFNGVTYYVR